MDEMSSFTVGLCRNSPGAVDVAEIALARGAKVRWCSPDCCGPGEEDDVSVFDDGVTDLDGTPAAKPATEARGGKAVDWDAVRPGEELPESQEEESA